ncbi:hypothetical protein [Prosthecobacter sp.]|uniref:hypothetical protein n=1 Tax=Prosthecobacter sp. TaxID=1965333 RepID=UPI0037850F4F
MSESQHPAWRSIPSGYLLPPVGEVVWGWGGAEVRPVVFHVEDTPNGGFWADPAGQRVPLITHWMPLGENPDQPPRAPDVWSRRHDGLSEPPGDAAFVWAFIGDEPPRRAQYRDDHWLDLEGSELDARSLKWLRDLEFTDPAQHS